jgi:glycosyltransferase involved in cell wall biosynthesis
MKVLFDHPNPFLLAHGGFQIQIEQTKAALQKVGVDVEYLHWWDEQQRGDIIHYFGTASNAYLFAAKKKQIPVAMTTLFTETCNRSDARLALQSLIVQSILKLPVGEGIKQQLTWRAFNNCAQNIVGLEAEKRVLQTVYSVPVNNISIVPYGLSETYIDAPPASRCEPHLICTGTITERKNSVQLAEMARAAGTPILFVGKPYHTKDPYWLQFQSLIDDSFVKYRPHVSSEVEMVTLLRQARGFVMMSDYENWCLSAHEGAACGLPLLVQDQKWSRERFGGQAHYFERIGNSRQNIEILKEFYAKALNLPSPKIKLYSWNEVAVQLRGIYEKVLSGM